MPRQSRDWNGKDVPAELPELPAGRHVVEAIDDAPALSPDEEAVADIVEAITYLNERTPTVAANLDAEIAQ